MEKMRISANIKTCSTPRTILFLSQSVEYKDRQGWSLEKKLIDITFWSVEIL